MNYIKEKVIIGLTGKYCSGKSTVEKILNKNHNFFIIDVDKIGHWALEEKKTELINKFGSKILKYNKINRKILGSIVFNNKKFLIYLNTLVHPIMIEKVKELIEENKNEKICINAALLFELNLNIYCSTVIVIKSSILNIIKRAKQRDKVSFKRIFNIINNQKIFKYIKKGKKYADICYINNNKSIIDFKNQINYILKKRDII